MHSYKFYLISLFITGMATIYEAPAFASDSTSPGIKPASIATTPTQAGQFSVSIPAPRADTINGFVGENVPNKLCGNGNGNGGAKTPYIIPYQSANAFCLSQGPVIIPYTGHYLINGTMLVGNGEGGRYTLYSELQRNGSNLKQVGNTFSCGGAGCFMAMTAAYTGDFNAGDIITMSVHTDYNGTHVFLFLSGVISVTRVTP